MNTLGEKKGAIAWMASNSVAANILMLLLLIGGLFAATRLRQEFLPEAELDSVFVTVVYPGASPKEVEQGIVLSIEESLRGIKGVKKIHSSSFEGSGTVIADIRDGVDANRVADDVRNAINRIPTFPRDAEKPFIEIINLKNPVLDLILSADLSRETLRELAEETRDKLLTHPGISQVELSNVRGYEIHVEITQQKLRELGLSLQEVARIITASSVELPGGSIRTDSGEILVRVMDRRDLGSEFARIPIITSEAGATLYLQDIATIRDGFDESDKFTTFNGKPSVSLTLFRVGDQSPVSVEKATEEVITSWQSQLPEGVEFHIWNSVADMYRGRMNLLLRNGLLGLVLVFILLSLFLEMRLAFWVMLGIPISFIGTFIFMSGADVSVNMISMFAFLISLGIVVDDAIVVGENIYYHHQDGLPFHQAAIRGAQQIAMPVCFSILTNIVAFMPLYFVPGIMGKFFQVIPLVVCSTFFISLIESLFILPAHLAHQKNQTRQTRLHQLQLRFGKAFRSFATHRYGPFLDRVLKARYLTVTIALMILIVTLGYLRSGRLGFEMFPYVESDTAACAFELPYGSPVTSTQETEAALISSGQRAAAQIEADTGRAVVRGIKSTIGGDVWGGGTGGAHAGRVEFELLPPGERPVSTEEFSNLWREESGIIKGLKGIRFRTDSGGPGGEEDAFKIDLSHRDMNLLEQASEELCELLADFPMVRDINNAFSNGKEQIDYSILPAGRSLGFTSESIAREVRSAYYGAEAIRQQRNRHEVRVKVRLPVEERQNEFSLEELILRTPTGGEVPLREIATAQRGRSPTAIYRNRGKRIISVSGDVEPRDQTPQILDTLYQELLPELEKKYPGLSYTFEGSEADRRESIRGLINGLLVALLLIYILLAIPFNSYTQPLIIMIVIPFGIVGAVIGHILLGYSLSLISLFGVVALSGVVVNDSLVFIDFANRRRRAGATIKEAIHQAGLQRFRPIILTTLTTFFGLMPMIVETSRQARFLIPMAISLGFGILFATGITLLLIPVLLLILDDVHHLFKREKPLMPPTDHKPPPADR